jgi:hypothetical protein
MLTQPKMRIMTVLALLAVPFSAGAQQTQSGISPNSRPSGPNIGVPFTPTQTDRYHADLVKLGGTAADGLFFQPTANEANPRVAIVTTYGVPAVELANRGYRVLLVRHLIKASEVSTPFSAFEEISHGINYVHTLAGVQRVVVLAWGSGATTMILYANVAEHGPGACQSRQVISPCTTEQATGLAKPDGVILLDPGSGAGLKVLNGDPAYQGTADRRSDLDMFTATNGYDLATGTAAYSAEFRKRYFAAQSDLNDKAIDLAIAKLKSLEQAGNTADEPFSVPGAVNTPGIASLHTADLNLLSHTKQQHTLLKADGSTPSVMIRSIRPSSDPKSEEAFNKAFAQYEHPRDTLTLRQFLANDAIRSTKDFALTEDDIVGIEWKSSNAGEPGQAEGVTVPSLVMTNTCFQFVVPSEIVFDHLAAKDKTYAGVEGSEHFFTPCQPQYGDTKKRLFDFVDAWLGKPGRF